MKDIKDMKGINRDNLFRLYIVLCVILSMMSLYFHIKDGIYFSDHEWWWKECACVLKGIDPAEAIRQNMVFADLGGSLPPSTATLPWAKIIGIVIHGAFLSYAASCIYYVGLNCLFFIWMIRLIKKGLVKKYKDEKLAWLGIISVFSSWYIVDWIQVGNNASIVCFCVISAICLMDDHEWIAGFLLGIAMIKPQIVLPFYIIWLFLRKWKAIAVSAGIVIVMWMLSVMITGTPALKQVSNLFGMRVEMEEDYLVYGIFDSLRHRGIDTKIVLFMSMIFGIVVCISVSWYLLKRFELDKNLFIMYITPALVSIFWCYKSQCDYNILMILAVALVEIWYLSSKKWYIFLGIAILEIVMLMKPFSAVNVAGAVLGIWDRNRMIYIFQRFDLYSKTVSFFIMIFLLLHSSILERVKTGENL